MPISHSVKHQSNALDCNSCDKLEHLPIKKRRFLLRSPSPPKIPSSINEENSKFSESREDPAQSSVVCPALSKSGFAAMPVDKEDAPVNHPSKVNEAIKCSEDFSGISMLAAAACSDMLGKESGNAQDGSGIEEPSVHEGPVNVSTNSKALPLSKGLVKEDCVNTIDNSTGGTSSYETRALAGEKVENIEKCIKEPFSEDGTPNMSSDVSITRDDDVAGTQNVQSQDHRLHWDLNVVMDAWDQPFHDQNGQTFDHIVKGSGNVVSCANRSAEDHDSRNELENPVYEVEKKLLHYEPRKSLDRISEGNTRILVDKFNYKSQNVSKNARSSLENANISAPTSLFKYEPTGESINFDVSAPLFTDHSNRPVPDKTCAAVTNKSSVSVIDTEVRLTCQPNLDIDNQLTLKSMMPDKPFDKNSAQLYITSQVNNDAMLEKAQGENDHRQGTKSNNDKFFMNGRGKVEVDFHISTKEVKIASAEHFEEKFISDTAVDPCSTHETEAAGKHQDDNDSQYEDGELREPTRHAWEEYDTVNAKPEPVDYVRDKSIYSVTAAEVGKISADVISSSRGIVVVHDPEADRLTAAANDDNGYGKDENVLKLVHSGDEKMKGPASTEMMIDSNRMSLAPVVRVGDDCEAKGRIYSLATRPPDPEDTNTRIGSRLYGRALLSENEGPCGHDRPFREDQPVNRSKLDGVAGRWGRGSTYMKSSDNVRYPMQSQPRAHPANNWHGSSDIRRRIKRNFSPTYNAHPKLDEGEDTVPKEDNTPYLTHPPTSDESIADVSPAGNFQPNHRGLGSDNRVMNRGRFIRYAGRGRYNGPSPDDSFQGSIKYRRPISQRDNSFSPNERSRSPDPRIFTRARSPRGRSPNGGGPYVRYKSRSPNFRSPRMRSPPNHQRFGGYNRPFQRDQGSPPPPSRWINNRKDDQGQHLTYKQRPMLDESPTRNRMRGPDVCYRQNNRFSEMEASTRQNRMEENYDNRRRQFGPIRRGDDGFVPMNRDVGEFRGNRDMDNRNGKFRRDNDFMYERSNSKQFGYNRSVNNPGRFNEMEGGAGRGQRYVDRHDERRRPFSSVYIPGRRINHDDVDNLPVRRISRDVDDNLQGRRISHDVNDNLQAALSSCNDDLPTRQREEQHLDLSGQEKKVGEMSKPAELEVAAEK